VNTKATRINAGPPLVEGTRLRPVGCCALQALLCGTRPRLRQFINRLKLPQGPYRAHPPPHIIGLRPPSRSPRPWRPQHRRGHYPLRSWGQAAALSRWRRAGKPRPSRPRAACTGTASNFRHDDALSERVVPLSGWPSPRFAVVADGHTCVGGREWAVCG
jgi:hypothetical protein